MAWYTQGGKVVITPGGQIGDNGGGAGFNFYISPTGDDNNSGTDINHPWSITALNSKQATYAGKRIGMLPGVYQYGTIGGVQTSLYTLCQNIGGTFGANPGGANALNINGGTTTPTYLASCNAAGFYSPRTAILFPADIVTGNRPTSESGLIGQAHNSGIANTGNVTIDGIVIRYWYQWAIAFFPTNAGAYPTTVNPNIRIQNCEVYDGAGYKNDNMAGIAFQACSGVYCGNNNIHDIAGTSGSGADCMAILEFSCHNNVYEFNSMYRTNIGIYCKNGPTGNQQIRYNLTEVLSPVQQTAAMADCMGGQASDTCNIHHNIWYCPNTVLWSASNIVVPEVQATNFYNNTCICNTNSDLVLGWEKYSGNFQNYNNVIIDQVHIVNGLICAVLGGPYILGSYNIYDDATHTPNFVTVPSPGGARTTQSFAAFQTATGQDSTSVIATPTFAGSFGVQNAANYQLTGSVGIGTGHVGGVAGGAAVNAGAWDGVVTQIGCNFSASLFVLTSSLPNATVGSAYSQTLTATGGTPPYVWNLVSASPNSGMWLTLSDGGVLSGTPLVNEVETIVVQVNDALGSTAVATL
jgi:hypothetical protein